MQYFHLLDKLIWEVTTFSDYFFSRRITYFISVNLNPHVSYFFVTTKSSVSFSEKQLPKNSWPDIFRQIYYPKVSCTSFPFYPKAVFYTYQMKKDVLQGAVLFWNPLWRIHSPMYTAIEDIKNRSKSTTRLESLCTCQMTFPKWSLLCLCLPWTLCITDFTARCLCHNCLEIHSEKNITLTCAVNSFLDHGLLCHRLGDCICVTESNVRFD